MSVTIGTNVAGYLVEEEIGRGGMGVVYRALDLTLERQVALKLIAPELADDPSFRARFLRESRIAASIEHRGILPVYAAGEAEGDLYLTTRLVEGVDLRAVLAKYGPLPAARALALVGQVADALDVAHSRGLVHRDVKPANILVENGDHCYLSDFGLTKQLADDGTTTSDLLAGSLDYLSPEQIRRTLVDGRADQYALACVLYECLSGAPPSRRDTEAQTLWAHLQEKPARLLAHPELDAVWAKALAKEPSGRFRSCTAFVEAARATQPVERTPQTSRQIDQAPETRRSRRGPAAIAIGAALLVIATLTAAAALYGRGRGEEVDRFVPVAHNTVVAVDPNTNDVVAEIPVGEQPRHVAVGSGFVWAYSVRDGMLTQIDASTKRAVRTHRLDGLVTLAAGLGAAWVTTEDGRALRIDPKSARIERLPVRLRNPPLGSVAVGAGSVWIGHRQLLRLNPRTRRVVARIDAPGFGVTVGEGAVWVALGNRFGNKLIKVDPRTNAKVASIRVYTGIRTGSSRLVPSGLVAGEGSVWLTPFIDYGRHAGRIWRIHPDDEAVVSGFWSGESVETPAAGLGALWVPSAVGGTLARVHPSTEVIVARLDLGGTPMAVAVGEGLVWVAVA